MKTFSTKEAIKRGWEIWKANKLVLTLAILIPFVVGMIPNFFDGLAYTLFEIALYLLSTFVALGVTKVLLKVESGEHADVSEVFGQGHLFWKYLLGSILFNIVVVLGFILLIVPGVYVALKYFFVHVLIADKGLSVAEAFKESARITDGVKWKLLGFGAVSILVILLGVLAVVIGLVVAIPVVGLAQVWVYRKLSALSASAAEPSSALNTA